MKKWNFLAISYIMLNRYCQYEMCIYILYFFRCLVENKIVFYTLWRDSATNMMFLRKTTHTHKHPLLYFILYVSPTQYCVSHSIDIRDEYVWWWKRNNLDNWLTTPSQRLSAVIFINIMYCIYYIFTIQVRIVYIKYRKSTIVSVALKEYVKKLLSVINS